MKVKATSAKDIIIGALKLLRHRDNGTDVQESGQLYRVHFVNPIVKAGDDQMSIEIYNWLMTKIKELDEVIERFRSVYKVPAKDVIEEPEVLKLVGASSDTSRCPYCQHKFGAKLKRGRNCPSCGNKFRVSSSYTITAKDDRKIRRFYKAHSALSDAIFYSKCARTALTDKKYLDSLCCIIDACMALNANSQAFKILADPKLFIQNKLLDYEERYSDIEEERARVRVRFEQKRAELDMHVWNNQKDKSKNISLPMRSSLLVISKALECGLSADDQIILKAASNLSKIKQQKPDVFQKYVDTYIVKLRLDPGVSSLLANL